MPDDRELHRRFTLGERLAYVGTLVCPLCDCPLPRGPEYLADRAAIVQPVGMAASHRSCVEAARIEGLNRAIQEACRQRDEANAESERLRRGVSALVATTRCLRRPNSKMDPDPGPCGDCAPCMAKQAYYGDDWRDS